MKKKTHTDVIEQARQNDTVAQELLFVEVANKKSAGGFEFIDTVLDMQDEFDDDFRPY